MKLYRMPIAIFALTGILCACDDSDSEPEETCLMESFTITEKGGSYLRYESTYNGDTLLEQTNIYYNISEGEEKLFLTTDVSYSGRNVIAMTSRRSGGALYDDLCWAFEYDDKGRQVTQIPQGGAGVYRLTYNDRDQLTDITFLDEVDGTDTIFHNINSFDARGNVVTHVMYSNVDGKMKKESTVQMEYDDRINPMKGFYYDFAEEPVSLLSSNNITKKTIVFAGGAPTSVEKFTYVYNSNGYPETRTSDLESGSTMTYTHQCK